MRAGRASSSSSCSRATPFWGTQAGAELDLLASVGTERIGIEVKRTDRPRLTKSMSVALADLSLDRIVVAHAGDDRLPLAERIEAVPVRDLLVGSPMVR